MVDNFSLAIKAVYSAEASAEESADCGAPAGLRLGRHQVATLVAYRDPNIDIIFNTAMTGDGKTLAAFLPALTTGQRACATYPTNELIRDQQRSVGAKVAEFSRRLNIRRMSGSEISRLMSVSGETNRAEEVKRLLDDADLLLTNPDLFHLLMSFNYGYLQRRELVHRLQSFFHYYIFDEFHIFGPPQVISIMNIINAVAAERRNMASAEMRRKFIFLSATPDQFMTRMLAASGLNFKQIVGEYSDELLPNYRRILAPCTLNLAATSGEYKAEQWVNDHVDELVAFYKQYPNSKGAIIVNSVAAARRLVARLKPLFEAENLTVGENTGLTDKETKVESFKKHLLIGTSTVDVGVDFQINLLIFEAGSAADFLQRFGRLGRHEGYTQDGSSYTFEPTSYRAYALCPRFVCERIAAALVEQQGAAENGRFNTPANRAAFNSMISTVYPNRQQFAAYANRWGLKQAASFILNLRGDRWAAADNYEEQKQETVAQFVRSFGLKGEGSLWRAIKEYEELLKDEPGKALLAEINSFRGTSLGCGVWDTTDGALKTYSLLYILANSRFEIVSEADFMAEVNRRPGYNEYDYRYQLLYLKVLEYLPEADSFGFSLPSLNLHSAHRDKLNHAIAQKGFRIERLRAYNCEEVNTALKGQRLVCTITSEFGGKPDQARRVLNLPFQFPIHPLSDNNGREEYCVAFGKQALLLDSLLWWRKNPSDVGAYFDYQKESV